jgi:hypothetical protein
MPQTLHTDAADVTRTTDEQFLELLYANEDLLRAEFDEIIAAQWPSPPPGKPDRGAAAERRPSCGRQHREASGTGPATRPRHPGVGRWTRQRSPPPAAATTQDRKGR